MTMSCSILRPANLVLAGVLLAASGVAAEVVRAPSPANARGAGNTRSSAAGRAVLPDPVLLDGSAPAHGAEKKTDYGMIGDFELPGEESAQKDKVGGGGSGQQPPEGQGAQAMGLPGGGGGAEGEKKPGGGQPGAQAAAAGGAGQEPKPGEKPGGGAGEPGAKAEGIQVAELGGAPSGMPEGQDALKKPSPVAIGDKAMRIPQSTQTTAGVVGAQQPAGQNTQVYEKGTGTGGKGSTATQTPNRTEKGRAIPAGL
jgi:hypothetical protein